MKVQLAAFSFSPTWLPAIVNSINNCRIYTDSDMRSGRKMDSVENFTSSWVSATTTAGFTMLVLMIFFFL